MVIAHKWVFASHAVLQQFDGKCTMRQNYFRLCWLLWRRQYPQEYVQWKQKRGGRKLSDNRLPHKENALPHSHCKLDLSTTLYGLDGLWHNTASKNSKPALAWQNFNEIFPSKASPSYNM